MTHWITAADAWAHVVFYERDEAKQKLFAGLVKGKVTAKAEHFTFQNAEHRNTQIPQDFWNWTFTKLDFPSGKANRTVADPFCSIDEHGERVVRIHSHDTATGIHIDRDTLLKTWPAIPGVDKPKVTDRSGVGGRSTAADWPAIEQALECEINLVGFPDRAGAPGWQYKADVIRFVRPLLDDDSEPAEQTLKENVSRMLERIRARKDGN